MYVLASNRKNINSKTVSLFFVLGQKYFFNRFKKNKNPTESSRLVLKRKFAAAAAAGPTTNNILVTELSLSANEQAKSLVTTELSCASTENWCSHFTI